VVQITEKAELGKCLVCREPLKNQLWNLCNRCYDNMRNGKGAAPAKKK
jgi:hypothetical protein